ncbi:hypothetical protein OP10G_2161 [Fimbriimonas ginsengisoli Gsoil 348]|uniref:Uncharacterized protein n=1 Tax=Fimbriimonas ginsengisoli Gsoil 348 TaxID=661478 RepID=A0A068NVD3_FIMGI|nr:hypothetical protein OP10G_2161 [Fimbriimonas ginsengisoli Gsoil 348]
MRKMREVGRVGSLDGVAYLNRAVHFSNAARAQNIPISRLF